MRGDEDRINGERTDIQEPRLGLVNFADIAPFDTGGGLIDGLLLEGSLSLLVGESGSLKSFLAVDMSMAIARHAETWCGRAVSGGPVIYIPAEAGKSFANRVVAYRNFNGLEDANIPFAIVKSASSIDLCDSNGDTGLLIDLIQQAASQFGAPVKLIVLDTVSRALNGADENSSRDMGALVANLDRISDETDTAVLGIHHPGKDLSRGPRGHSLLHAAVDTEIEIKADKDSGSSTARVSKQRDLPTEGNFEFRLEVVEIAKSANGRALTSCVVTDLKNAEPSAPRIKLTSKQRLALEVLRNVIIDHHQPAPAGPHYPPNATVVPVDLWRDCLFKAGVLDKNASNPRQPFKRIKDTLTEKGLIREWSDLLWIVANG